MGHGDTHDGHREGAQLERQGAQKAAGSREQVWANLKGGGGHRRPLGRESRPDAQSAMEGGESGGKAERRLPLHPGQGRKKAAKFKFIGFHESPPHTGGGSQGCHH